MTIALPEDLIWTDEIGWNMVEQVTDYSGTGAFVVDEWTRQAGRPITLAGTVDYAWILRAELLALDAWSRQAGLEMTLGRMGTTHSVIWNRVGGAVVAEQVVPYADPAPSDPYALTLRFFELEI